MVNSNQITDTESRLISSFNKVIDNNIQNKDIKTIIKNSVKGVQIKSGVVTKFYPYLNKSEVLLDNNEGKVLCKHGSLFGEELLLLYTPAGDGGYDEELRERFIKPRGLLPCFVASVNGHEEFYLLNFYIDHELTGLSPAKQGSMKLLLNSGTVQHYIKFGYDGLEIATANEISKSIRKHGTEELLEYDKDYYTRNEVDSLLNNLKEEILSELTENPSNNNNTDTDTDTDDT